MFSTNQVLESHLVKTVSLQYPGIESFPLLSVIIPFQPHLQPSCQNKSTESSQWEGGAVPRQYAHYNYMGWNPNWNSRGQTPAETHVCVCERGSTWITAKGGELTPAVTLTLCGCSWHHLICYSSCRGALKDRQSSWEVLSDHEREIVCIYDQRHLQGRRLITTVVHVILQPQD